MPLQCSVARPFCALAVHLCAHPSASRRFLDDAGVRGGGELVYSRVLNCLPRTERYLMMLTFKCDGRALPRRWLWEGFSERGGGPVEDRVAAANQCRIATLITFSRCEMIFVVHLLSKNYMHRRYVIIIIHLWCVISEFQTYISITKGEKIR